MFITTVGTKAGPHWTFVLITTVGTNAGPHWTSVLITTVGTKAGPHWTSVLITTVGTKAGATLANGPLNFVVNPTFIKSEQNFQCMGLN